MKQNKRTIVLSCCTAAALIALFLAALTLATRISDARLYATPQTCATAEGQLSAEGRSCLLASMLYAQAHLSETGGTTQWPQQGEQTTETVLNDRLKALQAANVLPKDVPQPPNLLYHSTVGLLEYYSADCYNGVQVEPATGKVVQFSWSGEYDEISITMEHYREYLELSEYDWQSVESVATGPDVAACYSSQLQLYISVTQDMRTNPALHSVSVVSMTPQQLKQIVVQERDKIVGS